MATSRLATRVSLVLGILVLAAYALHWAHFTAHINDDAFITFRYSRFLAMGRGPYFNVGEHVEGYTNFLLMLLMSAYIAIAGPRDVLLAAQGVGFLGGMGALLCTWALCCAWLRRQAPWRGSASLLAWAAAAIVALECGFALNSTSGLETTLFAGWIALGLWLVQRARDANGWRGGGVAFALAALTRPEGAWCFGAVFIARLIGGDWRRATRRRALSLDTLVVAGAVLAHLLFRLFTYDGELLPNTYYAKQGGFLGGGSAIDYCGRYAGVHGIGMLGLLALGALAAVRPDARRAVLPGLLVAAAGVAAIFTAGPDWMPGYRLLVPYLPVVAALSVAGLAALAGGTERRTRKWTTAACVALPLVLLAWQSGLRTRYHDFLATRAQGYVDGHAAAADWIASRASAGDGIALMDIGLIGYRCIDQRVLDITGLTDREIAKSPGSFLDKQVDPRVILERKPRFIVAVFEAPDDGPQLDLRKLDHWTNIEAALLSSEGFARHYLRLRAPDANDAPLGWLASQLGAEAVFRHDYPGKWYLLAVYERHEAAD